MVLRSLQGTSSPPPPSTCGNSKERCFYFLCYRTGTTKGLGLHVEAECLERRRVPGSIEERAGDTGTCGGRHNWQGCTKGCSESLPFPGGGLRGVKMQF